MTERAKLSVIPVTTATANAVVRNIHRHHGDAPPALVHFAIGCVVDGRLCGIAIVGRPANRHSDVAQTAEVLRVATDGTPNASSFLLGRAAVIAQQMGFARIITYTLEIEGGASLRGAAWERQADGIESWWHRNPDKNKKDGRTVVERPHHGELKVRWGRFLRDPLSRIDMTLADQPNLFNQDRLAI